MIELAHWLRASLLGAMTVEQFHRWVETADDAPAKFRAAADAQRAAAEQQAARRGDSHLSPGCCYTTGMYHMPWCTEEPRRHDGE